MSTAPSGLSQCPQLVIAGYEAGHVNERWAGPQRTSRVSGVINVVEARAGMPQSSYFLYMGKAAAPPPRRFLPAVTCGVRPAAVRCAALAAGYAAFNEKEVTGGQFAYRHA